MTCYGIDASHHNTLSQAKLTSARQAGALWFTHKASESDNFHDPNFGNAISWAVTAGLYVGAYHVIRTNPSAAIQGQFFLDAIAAHYDWTHDPNFIFQVDLEKWPTDSVTAAQGIALAQWLLTNTGRKSVFLYASKGQYGESLTASPVKLWNARYPNCPTPPCPAGAFNQVYANAGGDGGSGWASYSGQVPIFWQYTDNASFGSLTGVDASAYRGSAKDFADLVSSGVHPCQ